MKTTPKLIIGLGNPDKQYKKTYHNVGHLFIDYLGEGLKSDVYMNQSGSFALKELKKNNTKPDELLIAHDDSDIILGNYKLSYGRGSAGHKGVENIIKSLKTKNFWRLRIGIRKKGIPAGTRQKAEKFVLKKINKKDMETLTGIFEKAKADIE